MTDIANTCLKTEAEEIKRRTSLLPIEMWRTKNECEEMREQKKCWSIPLYLRIHNVNFYQENRRVHNYIKILICGCLRFLP